MGTIRANSTLSETSSPCVSVVIPNFNGLTYLERCLTSVFNQSYLYIEVIFVDNASVDQSCEYVKKAFPIVRIIENTENLGFSGGVNTGIRGSRGDYIFTLNTDTKLESDCISRLVSELQQFPDVGLCGPKLLFFDGSINSTGMFYSRGGAAWDRGMGEEDVGQYDGLVHREVMGVCAGAALYRKEMFDDIGLFDEDFFLIFEGYDLSLRAYLAGWRARYVPDARVYHVRGGTMESTSALSVFYGERNMVWVPIKNYSLLLLVSYLPFILWHNLLSILYWMKKGRGTAALQGKIASVTGMKKILKKRQTFPRL